MIARALSYSFFILYKGLYGKTDKKLGINLSNWCKVWIFARMQNSSCIFEVNVI